MKFGGSHNMVKSPVASAKAYKKVVRNYGEQGFGSIQGLLGQKINKKKWKT